jgi:AcrR family transcriptional regulator
LANRSTSAQLATSVALGHAGHHLREVAGVVAVVVREEHPPHVFGGDDREGVGQPLLAVRDGTGVDDHRLGSGDHHRVDVDGQRRAERRLHLVDEPGVGCDALGLDAHRRSRWGEVHGALPYWRRRSSYCLHDCVQHSARTRACKVGAVPRRYSMDTRAAASAATRTRVLDATVEVMGEVGATNLTMQAVAERADVALRTLYNHFPSREALVVEAYNRFADATQDAVRSLPATGPAEARLAAFVDAFYDSLEEHRLGAAVILAVTGIEEFDARLREVRAWRRRELATIVRAAEREGRLRVPAKQAVAIAFVWTSFATWSALADECKLSGADAKQVAREGLSRALFK